MANNEINDLTAKTTPVSTDEVEIQETAGGLSKKATVGNLAKGMSYNDLNDKPSIPTVSDTAYDATSWNGNTDAPTKNAVRDKIESMGSGSGDVTGPASSTNTAVAVFDGTTGKLLKNSSLLYNEAFLELSGMQDIRADNEIYADAFIATSGAYANTIYETTSGAGVTIDGVLVKDGEVDGVDVSTTYRTGGTDVALADGGTGASLTDPNADRIMFWDDSAGAVTWLTASTGLTLSGTNLTARAASETVTGISERATTTEAATGTDTSRHVTPAGLTSFLSANIGSTVQAYDADLTSWAGKTAPTGDAVGTTDTQTLTNKTLTTPTIAQINNSAGVKSQLDTQTDNSDTISSAQTAGVRVQYGWGQAQGSSTSTITDAVTFPTAFTTVLGVTVSWGGNKAGSGTDITAFTGATVSAFTSIGWSSPTTTGFDVTMTRSSGTFANTSYYAYSWIAWGV